MAAITKKKQLRIGTGTFGSSSNFTDVWQLRVDTQIDEFDLLALWLADTSLPQPQVTTKTVGGKALVCDSIKPGLVNTERYIWRTQVNWIEQSKQTPDQPNPVGGGDPDTWSPTITRRPLTVQLPAEHLFYESGYSGAIHTKYTAKTTADERSPFTNSAGAPYRDQLPPHQRKQSIWTIRWVRPNVPLDLIEAELGINDASITLAHRGFTYVWPEKTVKIESVSLTETKVGTRELWEIVLELLEDPDGHTITAIDQGMTEIINPGEPLPTGGSALVATPKIILDANKKPVVEPVLLDGSGKTLTSGDAILGVWRDFPLVDFKTLTLLKDLVS